MKYYSAFQIDELHRHNQNPVGANSHLPLLWSTEMKTAVKFYMPFFHSGKIFCSIIFRIQYNFAYLLNSQKFYPFNLPPIHPPNRRLWREASRRSS
ncbi:MAG: hypothetical protein F6K39_47885 [Okeania sp. SIO3B3]|nr:hypothetical protein [Okeania sp. SIO3B3]